MLLTLLLFCLANRSLSQSVVLENLDDFADLLSPCDNTREVCANPTQYKLHVRSPVSSAGLRSNMVNEANIVYQLEEESEETFPTAQQTEVAAAEHHLVGALSFNSTNTIDVKVFHTVTPPDGDALKREKSILEFCLVLAMIKKPRNIGRALCTCASKLPPPSQCRMLDKMKAKAVSLSAIDCTSLQTPPIRPGINYSNIAMDSTLPTSPKIEQSTIAIEKYIYYSLWNQVSLFSFYATQTICGLNNNQNSRLSESAEPAVPKPPGWRMKLIINLVDNSKAQLQQQQQQQAKKLTSENKGIPFIAISKKTNTANQNLTDYLIVIRGTLTAAEMEIDFLYDLKRLDDDDDDDGDDNNKGNNININSSRRAHKGFSLLAVEAWKLTQRALLDETKESAIGFITITGHSLGAAVASLLSYFASRNLPLSLPGNPNSARIRTILFAAPRVFDETAMQALSRSVILRSIKASSDVVPELPCARISQCSNLGVHRYQQQQYQQLQMFNYSDFYGSIEFGSKELPMYFGMHFLNVPLWHTYSYDCWTCLNARSTKDASSDTTTAATAYRPAAAAYEFDRLLPKSSCCVIPNPLHRLLSMKNRPVNLLFSSN